MDTQQTITINTSTYSACSRNRRIEAKKKKKKKPGAHTSLQLKEADERCRRVGELALDSVATRSRYGGGRESRKGRERQLQLPQGMVAMAVIGAWSSHCRRWCSHCRRWRHLPLSLSLHRHTLLAYNKIFFLFFSFFLARIRILVNAFFRREK